MCEKGKLHKGKMKQYMCGEYLGEFEAETCDTCGEIFNDEETVQKMEDIAKKKGVWALGATTKITKTGNSLAVRIPKKIADFLKVEDGTEVYIHPEKDKLIVEAR
jgi:hypothetical protein